MIVTDLDRTLLHADKTINDYTTSILKRCQDRGIKIVFATARPIRTVKMFLIQIKPDAVIYHNGALTYLGNEKILTVQIKNRAAKDLIFKIKHRYPNKKLSCEINDVLYANFDISLFWDKAECVITDFSDLPNDDVDKIIAEIQNHPEHFKEIANLLPDDLYAEIADNRLALIMNKNAAKHNAIKILMDKMNLSPENIIAFGDDVNDIGMLKYCGIGVCVDNAIDEVKEIANYICKSNDKDGVAHFIEEFILV